MKKVLSMVLAMATVASMTAVAFAAASDPEKVEFGDDSFNSAGVDYQYSLNVNDVQVYVVDQDNEDRLIKMPMKDKDKTDPTQGKVPAQEIMKGDSLYIPLAVGSNLEQKDVKKYKVKVDFLVGGDLLEAKPEIAYKKTANDGYQYFVQFTFKQAFVPGTSDIVAFMSVYKGSSNVKGTTQYATFEYGKVGTGAAYIGDANGGMTVLNNKAPYAFKFKHDVTSGSVTEKNVWVTGKDDTDVITFDGVGEFEGNFFEQGNLFLGFNTEYIVELGDAYPDAELNFVTFPGKPMFNKWGTMRLTNPDSDENDKYIYALIDGKLEAVDAKYDDDFEGYVFGAKVLGSYIISDKELDVDVFNNAVDTEEPTDTDAPAEDTSDVPTEVVKDNPNTGR